MKFLILLAFVALPARAETLLVCYPGGTVTAKQAEPAVEKLLRVLERLSEEPPGRFQAAFESQVAACRQKLAGDKPELAILSLGLFLEHQTALHLIPLARPVVKGQGTETLRVVMRKGGNLADLKGKKLVGSPMEELDYLKKVVFAGALDPTTELAFEKRPLKALRQLHAGEVDAVLVNDAQHRSLAELPFAADLSVVHTFAPQPLVGLVIDQTRIDENRAARLTNALLSVCADAEGKALCEVFGLERFEVVDPSVYAEAIQRWAAP